MIQSLPILSGFITSIVQFIVGRIINGPALKGPGQLVDGFSISRRLENKVLAIDRYLIPWVLKGHGPAQLELRRDGVLSICSRSLSTVALVGWLQYSSSQD